MAVPAARRHRASEPRSIPGRIRRTVAFSPHEFAGLAAIAAACDSRRLRIHPRVAPRRVAQNRRIDRPDAQGRVARHYCPPPSRRTYPRVQPQHRRRRSALHTLPIRLQGPRVIFDSAGTAESPAGSGVRDLSRSHRTGVRRLDPVSRQDVPAGGARARFPR